MEPRADAGLAFALQYENVAWYESGAVRILDRRVYPQVRFVTCRSHGEVAQAIADMVTQSAGPFTACAMGMALAAWECRDRSGTEQLTYLKQAAHTLSHARPTTVGRMELITGGCLAAAERALAEGRPVPEAIRDHTVHANNVRYRKVERMGAYLADLLPDGGKVLTQCYAETVLGMFLKAARAQNKRLKIFCAETRPYFQGARLTATVCRDMGFDTTVITDNMPAYVMEREGIDLFTSAADAICLDGTVVNKVGTFQIAIAANYLGVPYYVTGAPDRGMRTRADVTIEMRDPEFTLQAMGVRTAARGVKGYYPAFDVTPPSLVTGVVTDQGIYRPAELEKYFASGALGEFEMVI